MLHQVATQVNGFAEGSTEYKEYINANIDGAAIAEINLNNNEDIINGSQNGSQCLCIKDKEMIIVMSMIAMIIYMYDFVVYIKLSGYLYVLQFINISGHHEPI